MKMVIVFIIILVSAGIGNCMDLRLEEDWGLWRGKVMYIFDRNDILKSTAVNLLDGDDSTPSAVLFREGDTNFRAFEVYFKEAYPVDRIAFKNAGPSNTNFMAVKDIRIITSERKVKDDKVTTNEITNSVIRLYNTGESQEFLTDRPVGAFKWRFEVLSVYSGGMWSGSGPAALCGIEFYDGVKKYTVTNIEAVKAKFREGYRKEQLGWITGMFGFVREATYRGGPESFAKRWNGLGVDVKKMEMIVKDTNLTINLEFTTNGTYGGDILAGKVKGQIDREKSGFKGNRRYHFRDFVKIGEWKLDETGSLWIKAGKGEWKKEEGFMSFSGTDLEGLGSVMSVNF